MIEEFQDRQRRKAAGVRSVMDIVMGSLFVLLGLYFLLYNLLGINVFQREPSLLLDIVLGILFLAYGVWRIYRGYKKQYFK